jgi:membrane-associated phospholipid phosphatase
MLFLLIFALVFVVFWAIFYAAGPALSRALGYAAHRTASFRYRDYLPVLLVIIIGIVATMFAGDAFLDIAESVHANNPQLQNVDYEVHAWAATTRTNGSTSFFVLMSTIGGPAGLAVIVGFVSLALILKGHWRWAAYLLLTSMTGAIIDAELKTYFSRARPELAEALRRAHGFSFPSGHSMGSAVVFSALAYLAFRALRDWRLRAAALALAATLILAVATSRVYLGVHWISDVGAGIAAGLIWFATATVAYETFRRVRLVRAVRSVSAKK